MKKFMLWTLLAMIAFLSLSVPAFAQETAKNPIENWIPVINTLITILVPAVLLPILAKWLTTKKKKDQAELLVVIAENIFKAVKYNNPDWPFNKVVDTALATFKEQLSKINPAILKRVMQSVAEDNKPLVATK